MNTILSEVELKGLLTCTEMFMNHVHFVQQSFNLIPDKDHYGTCINYIYLQECRGDFCSELINTVSEWVYSKEKAKTILDNLVAVGRTPQNAQIAFSKQVFDKFRNSDGRKLFIQGQFGELLLFNFLQIFFSAVPLLRKMPITTSAGMERFGADAIHYTYREDKHLFYLGESKTYASKYQFSAAFKDAIDSILKTYEKHREELGLYIYDDFVDDKLIDIARQYKNGMLKNAEVHLVAIIVYNETEKIDKYNESQIKSDIIRVIEERGRALSREVFNIIKPELHPRFNYIILPIWELDKLIEQFQIKLGK